MLRNIISVLLTVTLLSQIACMTLRLLTMDEISTVDSDSELQVVLRDSSELRVFHPVFQDEQLTGQDPSGNPVRISKDQIRAMAVRERDRRKTLMVGIAGTASVLILIGALSIKSSPSGNSGST